MFCWIKTKEPPKVAAPAKIRAALSAMYIAVLTASEDPGPNVITPWLSDKSTFGKQPRMLT
jgi:hypothetical protein